jgi:hypothetical protein
MCPWLKFIKHSSTWRRREMTWRACAAVPLLLVGRVRCVHRDQLYSIVTSCAFRGKCTGEEGSGGGGVGDSHAVWWVYAHHRATITFLLTEDERIIILENEIHVIFNYSKLLITLNIWYTYGTLLYYRVFSRSFSLLACLGALLFVRVHFGK